MQNIEITRRQLLQAAGGMTFLALTSVGDGLYAASFDRKQTATNASGAALPLFTALPYIQPGVTGSKLTDGAEGLVIAWQINETPANFTVEYGPAGSLDRTGNIVRQERLSAERKVGQRIFNHTATLTGLKLNSRTHYRVRMEGHPLLEGYFTTRKPRGTKTRFVAFGDNSYGDISDRAIAYQTYKTRPDFVMNTGDNVYEGGLDNEYARYFFPVYNAELAGQRSGAPLLRSVPFYSILANHDVNGKDEDGYPIADFDKSVDSLAYYTNFHFPTNGPKPSRPTPTSGTSAALTSFLACAGSRYPNMANYSYDYGDAHFLCLDSNTYVDPTDTGLQSWIAADLSATDAAWKFVVYHHPAFNAGQNHYAEQHMRVLSPIFEQYRVDVVLHGHEHTYQRTRPLRFAPTDITEARDTTRKKRLVPGKFTIDRQFDGNTVTKPDGILYITTGAGGKELYDPGFTHAPAKWLHSEDDKADYVACFISDRHSLTVFDMDHRSLSLTQIDEWGREIDRVHITKG
jgi:acid phosphatase type 7